MVLRHSLSRHGSKAFPSARSVLPASRRGLAAPASGSFQYQTGESTGVKYASRDLAGPTSTIALVAKAGTRYQPLPGLAEGLQRFAFRNTNRRSALRLQREAELFGGTLFSYHNRESIVLGAKFFNEDLPYFLEVLAEVASETKYLDYEFVEQVMAHMKADEQVNIRNPANLALASAHALAFHRGLGETVNLVSTAPVKKYLSADAIGAYSTLAYQKSNIALVGNGVDHAELGKWTGQFFKDFRTSPAPGLPPMETSQTKWFGGEERISHANGNSIVIAFPGSSTFTGGFYKPEVAVLAALLGGKSNIKWSPGFSALSKIAYKTPGLSIETKSAIYSDAGLLYTSISGSSGAVTDAAAETVKTIKDIAEGNIASDDIKRAIAIARFNELESSQNILTGLELTGSGLVHEGKPYQLDESAQSIAGVTEQSVRDAAKSLLEFKAVVSTVGDLFALPYASELGLQV